MQMSPPEKRGQVRRFGKIVFSTSYCFHLLKSPAEIVLHLTSVPHERSSIDVLTLLDSYLVMVDESSLR